MAPKTKMKNEEANPYKMENWMATMTKQEKKLFSTLVQLSQETDNLQTDTVENPGANLSPARVPYANKLLERTFF